MEIDYNFFLDCFTGLSVLLGLGSGLRFWWLVMRG